MNDETFKKPRIFNLNPGTLIVSDEPILLMTEDQIKGVDLEGAHAAMMKFINEIEGDIIRKKDA
ncbi:MAG: hypothetical protein DM484_05505 [Candidatus Methylumidiphilus alinenensis]|uniref:Uncharacterized protein n=1 Tax=Candidatus Methylumidiphilus alinenensis TaxID=2202197 RepID=A0A2W4RG70_9GAMM|nr:MAG: hypothetical protein DM484_05505 [Candidatus Methylumidiphilus alinenensis]